MELIRWSNACIKIGFYLLLGLVPLLLTPWNYELFEYNKMMAVYGITAFVATAWLIKMIALKELRIARTPLDIPIWLFVTSQFLSALFSIDPHVSWLGYYSRFNGGMWSVISYVVLYYTLVSNAELFTKTSGEADAVVPGHAPAKTRQKSPPGLTSTIPVLLKAGVLTGVLVAFYGVLERLGIDKHLWVQDVQNRVFSTLGQPNWLAAYLVALMPLTMSFALKARMSKFKDQINIKAQSFKYLNFGFDLTLGFWIWSLLSILFFVVLLFTRSRSGLLGLIVADVLFWGLLLFTGADRTKLRDMKKHPLFKPAAVLHVLFALIVFINGTGSAGLDKYITFAGWRGAFHNVTTKQNDKANEAATPSAEIAGPALEVGGTESGIIRKYVWQAAVNAWASSLKTQLIGTGTETFAFAFYEFRPVAHNQTSEWDFLYNKAHNEYLNYLATTGLFGLGSYLLFIGTFIWWFVKMLNKKLKQVDSPFIIYHLAFSIALFAGWISILVTNFFGFSVVILQLFLFLFPAMVVASEPEHIKFTVRALQLRKWMLWVMFFAGIITILRIGSFWYADTRYARGYRLARSGMFGAAISEFAGAISLNFNEPAYHDELGSAYATLAVAAFEGSNATQAAQLAALAINESVKAISTSPRNVNFYKTRTKVYYTLSALEPTFNAKAVEALQQAIVLSPNDPKIYYNLAILVGREGESEQAIQYLQKAKTLKSNYRDVYYALWVFFTEEKKPNDARAILQEYLSNVDPNDKDFLERIK